MQFPACVKAGCVGYVLDLLSYSVEGHLDAVGVGVAHDLGDVRLRGFLGDELDELALPRGEHREQDPCLFSDDGAPARTSSEEESIERSRVVIIHLRASPALRSGEVDAEVSCYGVGPGGGVLDTAGFLLGEPGDRLLSDVLDVLE